MTPLRPALVTLELPPEALAVFASEYPVGAVPNGVRAIATCSIGHARIDLAVPR